MLELLPTYLAFLLYRFKLYCGTTNYCTVFIARPLPASAKIFTTRGILAPIWSSSIEYCFSPMNLPNAPTGSFHCRMNLSKGIHDGKRDYCIDPAVGSKNFKNLKRRPNWNKRGQLTLGVGVHRPCRHNIRKDLCRETTGKTGWYDTVTAWERIR